MPSDGIRFIPSFVEIIQLFPPFEEWRNSHTQHDLVNLPCLYFRRESRLKRDRKIILFNVAHGVSNHLPALQFIKRTYDVFLDSFYCKYTKCIGQNENMSYVLIPNFNEISKMVDRRRRENIFMSLCNVGFARLIQYLKQFLECIWKGPLLALC
jgi:hypothetical protein